MSKHDDVLEAAQRAYEEEAAAEAAELECQARKLHMLSRVADVLLAIAGGALTWWIVTSFA